jgi:phospholipid-binding lipoprotein MlaA
MKKSILFLAGLALSGCASLPSGKPDSRDPWERYNRSIYAFNDALDRHLAKPVAKAYVKVLPRFVRTGVNNFFNNLDNVGTVVNDALQGKFRQAGHDSARFLLNSTFGIAGLLDPATAAGLEMNNEDFGQTMGKWGSKPGPYFLLPFLGPSTVRDTVGTLVDQFTYPLSYLQDDSTRIILRGVNLLDTRANLLDLDAQIDKSYDRYAFIRNAWLQRREFQVTDGNVDDSSLDLEQGMDAEPAPEAAPEQPAPEQPAPDNAAPPADKPADEPADAPAAPPPQ